MTQPPTSPRPEPSPPPITPVPAATMSALRGCRVVVGVPGVGFRGDLRADDAVVRGSRTFVPVLTEQDYYRAETEQLEVFAPLVPIDRVWVESAIGPAPRPGTGPGTLDAPPAREPVPARIASHTMGQRMIEVVPDGFIRDLRAVTNVYMSESGMPCVRICGEAHWYRWGLSGEWPQTTQTPAHRLWVE